MLGVNGSANKGQCGSLWWKGARQQERTAEVALELVLATGERLRIGNGVDTATLRTVLDVLRA